MIKPILVDFGPVALKTLSLFNFLAFLTAAFIYWRKTREEHYSEIQAFDAFLLSSLVGLLSGRLGFVLLNWEQFKQNLWSIVDIVNLPGSMEIFALLGAGLYLYRLAKRQKWDAFEILDFWVLAVSGGMVLRQIGSFLAGVGFGIETDLPWGVVFPGVFAKHHPTQLYQALFFVILYSYLFWAEYNYRTFEWYRSGKKTAQTGFLTSIFLLSAGVIFSLLQWLKPASLVIGGWELDYALYLGLALWGGSLLYLRSGRKRKDKSTSRE